MSEAKNPYREYSGTMPIADPVADIWDQGAKAGAETERADLKALREAAAALIAALPRCNECGQPATLLNCHIATDGAWCDNHKGLVDEDNGYAAPLRALLALLPPATAKEEA